MQEEFDQNQDPDRDLENQKPEENTVQTGEDSVSDNHAEKNNSGQSSLFNDQDSQPEDFGEDDSDSETDEAFHWKPEPDKLVQALIFASPEYINYRTIREIMGPEWDNARIRELIKSINTRLAQNEEPFEIVEVNGTFRYRTITKYYPWVRKLFKDSRPRRLSQASLETLAIVAYKQPVTKAEVEAIRGVNADGALKSLLDKKLIDIAGRSDALGNPSTYATTKEFNKYFGISKVPEDLPKLSDFEDLIHSQALLPQMRSDGSLQEEEQPEEDPNQLKMDMGE